MVSRMKQELRSMPITPVIIEKKDRIATLVLNRPEVMNAMSKEMILELHDAVKEIAADEGAHVVVLKGCLLYTSPSPRDLN